MRSSKHLVKMFIRQIPLDPKMAVQRVLKGRRRVTGSGVNVGVKTI